MSQYSSENADPAGSSFPIVPQQFLAPRLAHLLQVSPAVAGKLECSLITPRQVVGQSIARIINKNRPAHLTGNKDRPSFTSMRGELIQDRVDLGGNLLRIDFEESWRKAVDRLRKRPRDNVAHAPRIAIEHRTFDAGRTDIKRDDVHGWARSPGERDAG